MANEIQGFVDGLQALGEGTAKYWFLTVVLPLVVASLGFVTLVVLLIHYLVTGYKGRQREGVKAERGGGVVREFMSPTLRRESGASAPVYILRAKRNVRSSSGSRLPRASSRLAPSA